MQEIPVQEKYLLTIHEASEYFSSGIKSMRRIAEDHTDSFAIRHGSRYLIIRAKCEEYILGCLEKKITPVPPWKLLLEGIRREVEKNSHVGPQLAHRGKRKGEAAF